MIRPTQSAVSDGSTTGGNVSSPSNAMCIGAVVAVVFVLFVAYGTTLLGHVAGSNDPFMEDGGEIQVALNVWGTIHGTGYPLFTFLGNGFVHIARALGVSPESAPSVYALAWGILALALFYAVLRTLTGQFGLALGATLLLGLSRAVWAYNVLPKTYSMSLAYFVAILAIALWPGIPARRRFWLLALVGGFGVAHHRLIAFAIPGTLVAVLPALWNESGRKWQPIVKPLAIAVPLALVGFLPYVYLPARALAHGVWVYGDPSTWPGFWHEFSAQEDTYLFALPTTFGIWLSDVRDTLQIFIGQLSPIGAALAIPLAVYAIRRRREARIALLCALPLLAFVLIWHRAVVAQAVVEPVVMFVVFMAVLAVADLLLHFQAFVIKPYIMPIVVLVGALGLILWSWDYLGNIVFAREGDNEIALAHTVPRDNGQAIFMLPWGMRYSAVAFSHYVTGENADLAIADHKADFAALLSSGHSLYTDRDTFYRFPLSWWDSRIGRVYLANSRLGVVQIRTAPIQAPNTPDPFTPIVDGIVTYGAKLDCSPDSGITLHVTWGAQTAPARDFSVFVHLIGRDANDVLATADESAPVYGWYPTSRWSAGEAIPDFYILPTAPKAIAVQFGLYEQPTPGQFVNYGVTTLPLPQTMECMGS
ncbi:MAG: hypothetical protein ACYDBJ_11050 [Aggregatilineales bacterium]